MPVNQIEAPYYLRIVYQTWASTHNLTLYLGSGTLTPNGADYQHSAADLPAVNPGGYLSKLVQDVFDAFYHYRAVQPPSIISIDLYQSLPGPNTFVGSIKPSQPLSGTSQGTAASYVMLTGIGQSNAINRQTWRLMLFEAVINPAPQRYVVDWSQLTSEFHYLYLYSQQNALVSQDGGKISLRSMNIGYNRKLARRYGRLLFP